MGGKVRTPPPLLPPQRERTFFVPVEFLKEALNRPQPAKVKTFFKIA
ncbi:MAG: hypothetical protein K2Z81_27785 [Cyanobacteria bacterium]|nr:hypothetical protein [Cyanobacteriota bacterium]